MKLNITLPNPSVKQLAELETSLLAEMSENDLSILLKTSKQMAIMHINMGRALIPTMSPTEVIIAIFPYFDIIAPGSNRVEKERLLNLLIYSANKLSPTELKMPQELEVNEDSLAIWKEIMSKAADQN